jgi:Holliday junction resolvase
MTSNKENEVVDLVQDAGYLALREPASGAKNDLDVIMVIEGRIYFMEHKYGGKGREVRFDIETDHKGDPGDVVPLIEFAEKYGAIPVLCCRFAHDTTHYLIDAYDYADYEHGSVGFTKDKRDEMTPIEELFEDGNTGFETERLNKIL